MEPSPIDDVTGSTFLDPCTANFDDTDGTPQTAAKNRILEIRTNYEHGALEVSRGVGIDVHELYE